MSLFEKLNETIEELTDFFREVKTLVLMALTEDEEYDFFTSEDDLH